MAVETHMIKKTLSLTRASSQHRLKPETVLSEVGMWCCPQGTGTAGYTVSTFVNRHDYGSKGFETEVFYVPDVLSVDQPTTSNIELSTYEKNYVDNSRKQHAGYLVQ